MFKNAIFIYKNCTLDQPTMPNIDIHEAFNRRIQKCPVHLQGNIQNISSQFVSLVRAFNDRFIHGCKNFTHAINPFFFWSGGGKSPIEEFLAT